MFNCWLVNDVIRILNCLMVQIYLGNSLWAIVIYITSSSKFALWQSTVGFIFTFEPLNYLSVKRIDDEDTRRGSKVARLLKNSVFERGSWNHIIIFSPYAIEVVAHTLSHSGGSRLALSPLPGPRCHDNGPPGGISVWGKDGRPRDSVLMNRRLWNHWNAVSRQEFGDW